MILYIGHPSYCLNYWTEKEGDGIVARSLYSLADSDEEKDEKKDDE